MLFNKIPLTDCFWITFFLFSLFFDSKLDCLAMKESIITWRCFFLISDPDVKTLPNSLELLYTKPVSRSYNFIKKESRTGVFLLILSIFQDSYLSFIYVFTANVTPEITSRWHVVYGYLRYEGRVFCITSPSVLH